MYIAEIHCVISNFKVNGFELLISLILNCFVEKKCLFRAFRYLLGVVIHITYFLVDTSDIIFALILSVATKLST